jgi:hypothetical protein
VTQTYKHEASKEYKTATIDLSGQEGSYSLVQIMVKLIYAGSVRIGKLSSWLGLHHVRVWQWIDKTANGSPDSGPEDVRLNSFSGQAMIDASDCKCATVRGRWCDAHAEARWNNEGSGIVLHNLLGS